MHWPGAQVAFNGKSDWISTPYNGSLSCLDVVEQIKTWIASYPDIGFIAAYLNKVDKAGHDYGPYSVSVNKALSQVDQAIGSLMEFLKLMGLEDDFEIVIVGDHGMTEQHPSNMVALQDIVGNDLIKEKIKWMDLGPVSSIWPFDKDPSRLVRALRKRFNDRNIPCNVVAKDDVPREYNYWDSVRIPPIVVECKAGWALKDRSNDWVPKGQHGYDPQNVDMNSIFIARGASIKKGILFDTPQNNVNVFRLLCKLLDLEEHEVPPDNGTNQLCRLTIK